MAAGSDKLEQHPRADYWKGPAGILMRKEEVKT